MHAFEYRCKWFPSGEVNWNEVEAVYLSDTTTGEKPRLQTTVKMCRTESYLHVRFECEDDHIVATYTKRDDPIYKEDVVEIFLDESGEGKHYKEYEFSPRNVVFDALIDKEPGMPPKVDTSWNDEGLRTEIAETAPGLYTYDIALPVASLIHPPVPGMMWSINFYRIDEDPQGKRHYWAWSPTGKVNFHVPERFGKVILE